MTRVALTGTPGTGKTSVADAIDIDLDVVHLGELIDREGLVDGYDPVRESTIVDLDGLRRAMGDRDHVLFESHLAHHLEADLVIVLRCRPAELEARLRERSIPERSIRENAESEAIDLILTEAVDRHGRDAVAELDTTDRSVETVATEVEAVVRGDCDPGVGNVDFMDYL